jgi:hypothetical protein
VTVAKVPLSVVARPMILKLSAGLGVNALESIASVPSSETAPLTSRRSNCVSVVPAISSASVPFAPCV